MPRATVEDGTNLRAVPAATDACPLCGELFPAGAAHSCQTVAHSPLPANVQMLMAPLGYGLGTREDIQRELDGMAAAVRTFPMKQPDQIMRETAAYSARLTELAVLLHRVEATDRQYVRVRTQQVERWQRELENQFKVASRLVEVMRQDIALMGGHP